MFDKKKRRIEAFVLAAVTALASFSVNWSSLASKAAGDVFTVENGQSFVQIIKGTSDYTNISSLQITANLEEQENVNISTQVYVGSSIDANALSSSNLISNAGTSFSIKNSADAPTATDEDSDVEYTETGIQSGNILGKTISLSSSEYAAIKVTVNSISGSNSDNDYSSVDFVEQSKSGVSDSLFTPIEGSTALSQDGSNTAITGSSYDTNTTPSTDDTSHKVVISDSDKTVNLVLFGNDKTSKDVSVSIEPSLDRAIKLSAADSTIVSISDKTITAAATGTTTVTATAPGATEDTLTAYVYNIVNNTGSLTYNGNPQSAAITVSLGTQNLTAGKDYTVTYVGDTYSSTAAPTAAGTYAAVITGLGQYSGLSYTISNALTISKANLSSAKFNSAAITIDTDSNTVTAVSGATDSNGNALTFGTDFTATSVTPQTTSYAAGKAYYDITFTGTGNYEGTYTLSKYEVATSDTSLIDISKNFTLRLTKSSTSTDAYTEDTYSGKVFQPGFIFLSSRTATESQASLPSNAYTYTWTDPNGNSTSVDILNAGKYTLTVTGNQAQGYTGTLTATFTVNPIEIFDYTVNENTDSSKSTRNVLYDIAKSTFVYTGSSITPEITNVRYYATPFVNTTDAATTPTATLRANTDYTISTETNGGSVGSHYAEIVGRGNYAGVVKVPYKVVGNLANSQITIGGNSVAATSKNNWVSGYTVGYTGEEYKPKVVVTLSGFTLAEGVDYDISYSNNEDASVTTGDTPTYGTVTITGLGAYDGQTQNAYFTITPLTLDSDALTITETGKTKSYTGSEITLTSGKDNDYYVTYGTSVFNTKVLTEGTDYTLNYVTSNHTDAGTVSVTATGIGNYSGTTDAKTFTITPLDAANTTISLDTNEYEFDGTAKTPAVTVTDTKTQSIIPSTNYDVTYSDNTSVGNATVTITGRNNLTGKNTTTFKIVAKSLAGLTFKLSSQGKSYTYTSPAGTSAWTIPEKEYALTYTGRKITPIVEITDGSYTLSNGTDYYVTYINNVNVGTSAKADASPTIFITGKNNYAGSTYYFRFNIGAKSIDSSDITKKASYSSSNKKVTFKLKDKTAKSTLASPTDYTITSYDSSSTTAVTEVPTAAGEYTATLTGTGNYTGTTTVTYDIGDNLKNARIYLYANNNDKTAGQTFEYLAGNYPYIKVVYDGNTLTGPTYSNGAYTNDNTTSDYTVSFEPDSLDAGNRITITVSANEKNTGTNYFGTCTTAYDSVNKLDYTPSYAITKRDISRTDENNKFTYVDANAKSDSGSGLTEGDPIRYAVNDTGTTTPNITGTYTPVYNVPDVGDLSVKSGTFSTSVVTDNSDNTVIDTSTAGNKGTMTVTGLGNYTGTKTLYYEVEKADKDQITVGEVDDITYDGNAHEDIDPEVKLGDRVLTKGTDYTIEYPDSSNYTDVGTYNYKIVATDDSPVFTGEIDGTFKIVQADLSTIGAAVSNIANQTYTGREVELKGTKDATMSLPNGNYFRVIRQDKTTNNILTPSTNNSNTATDGDYYFTYSRLEGTDYTDHTDPGAVVLTIHGRGNYKGTVTKTFYISANIADTSLFTVNGGLNDGTKQSDRQKLYLSSDGSLSDGNGKIFSLSNINITYAKTTTSTGTTDATNTLNSQFYTVSNPDLSTVGDKTLTISGNTPYATGTRTYYLSVVGETEGIDVALSSGNGVTVAGQNSDGSYNLDYNGTELHPSITVSFRGQPVSSTDYTVSYNSCTEVGDGTIVVTGTGSALKAQPPKIIYVHILYNLSKAAVDFGGPYTYTGSEIKPTPTVSINGTVLAAGTDYSSTVQYQSNTSVGTAYGTISSDTTTSGRSYGSKTASFTIAAEPLVDGDLSVSATQTNDYTGVYNGSEQKPTVTVKHNGTTLTLGTDYIVSYANNVNAGTDTATVTVTGMGGYTGTLQKTFSIAAKGIDKLTDISVGDAYFIGDGVAVTPTVVVKDGNTTLTEGTDYSISDWNNNTDVGQASFKLNGMGNYDSSKTVTFTIKAADLSNSAISLDDTVAEYTGSTITPTVTVKIKNGDSYATVDSKYYTFTVTDSGSIVDAGNYTCKITAATKQKKFTGTKTFNFTVAGKELNFIDDTWNSTSTDTDDTVEDKYALYYQDENGKWQELNKDTYPSFTYDYAVNKEVPGICLLDTSNDIPNKTDQNTVGVNGLVLKKGTDYELTYTNNGAAGSAKDTDAPPTITITGEGNYKGTIARTYSIGTDLNSSSTKVTLSKKSFYYNGENQYPTVLKVSYNGKTLTADTDYTVTYPTSNIDAGEYSVAVKGKGKYYGTFDADYTIKAKTLSSGKLKIVYTDNTLQEKSGKYYTYYNDGEKFEPAIDVYDTSVTVAGSDNGLKLEESDYDVTYGDDTHDNITGGTTGRVKVTLKGNYSGTKTASFEIKKIDISGFELSFTGDIDGDDTDGYTALYTGQAVTSDFYISGSESDDANGTVYSIDSTDDDASTKITSSFTNNTDVGKATFTVTGTGNYTGVLTRNITIQGDLEDTDLTTVTVASAKYTGSKVTPTATVTFNGKTLTEGTDYTVSYDSDDNYTESGTATITGIGNYIGTVNADFTITFDGVYTMSGLAEKYPYTGSTIKPDVTITNSETGATVTPTSLTYSSSVDGESCIEPGTVTVTAIVDAGERTAILTGTYEIVAGSIYDCDISGLESYYNYTGSVVKPISSADELTVSLNGVTVPSKYYYIEYPDSTGYTLPGTYTLRVYGKDAYSGTKDLHYVVRVPSVTNLKATKSGTTTATISWTAVGVATGYRITYTVNSKRYIYTTTNTSYDLSGLPTSSSTTVSVAAYLISGSNTYYSATSNVSVMTSLTTPTITSSSASTSGNVIGWNKVSTSGGYMIYRCATKNGTYYAYASVSSNVTSYTDTRALSHPGRTYYYKVRSFRVDSEGNKYDFSDYSDAVGIKTHS